MTRSILAILAAFIAVAVLSGTGCVTTGIGDPCIPEQEYVPTFEGFDPEEVADPLAPENRLKTSGRGIFYMRTFMDDVRFRRHASGGMEIVLKKNLGAVNEKEGKPA